MRPFNAEELNNCCFLFKKPLLALIEAPVAV